jgi:hypothetical protein
MRMMTTNLKTKETEVIKIIEVPQAILEVNQTILMAELENLKMKRWKMNKKVVTDNKIKVVATNKVVNQIIHMEEQESQIMKKCKMKIRTIVDLRIKVMVEVKPHKKEREMIREDL